MLSNAFGKSEAERQQEEMQRRQQEAIRFISGLKQRALSTGINQIGRQSQGMIASGRSAAMARASAEGRSGEAESYMLPIEAQGAQAGNEAMSRYVTDTNQNYDRALEQVSLSGVNAPMVDTPTAGDYLMPIGQGLIKYGLGKRNPTTTTTPESSVTTTAPDFSTQGGFQPTMLDNPPEGSFRIAPRQTMNRMDQYDYRSLSQNAMSPGLRARRGLQRASIF